VHMQQQRQPSCWQQQPPTSPEHQVTTCTVTAC
jgi:hypothetical protein